MKLEGVGAVTMGGLLLEVGGEVDDGDGFKRTFLTSEESQQNKQGRGGGRGEKDRGRGSMSAREHT